MVLNFTIQALQEQLNKEKSAKESLREIVSTAESMLRVARSRIVNLEKQVKEGKTELDAAKRKQKELEQLVINTILIDHNKQFGINI